MLVISCRKNESVHIGGGIMLTVVEIRGNKVRLTVAAPKEMPVHREEVRDILYGAPPSAIIDPAWLTWNDGTVWRLARAIAEEGNYGILPILADALEEAGCADADILGHCRSCGQDVRNSWVVNRILVMLRLWGRSVREGSALVRCGYWPAGSCGDIFGLSFTHRYR